MHGFYPQGAAPFGDSGVLLAGIIPIIPAVTQLSFDQSLVTLAPGQSVTIMVTANGPASTALITPYSDGGGTFAPASIIGPGPIVFTAPMVGAGVFNIGLMNDSNLANPMQLVVLIATLDGSGDVVAAAPYVGARAPIGMPPGDLERLAQRVMNVNPRLFANLSLTDVMKGDPDTWEYRLHQTAIVLLMLGVVES